MNLHVALWLIFDACVKTALGFLSCVSHVLRATLGSVDVNEQKPHAVS